MAGQNIQAFMYILDAHDGIETQYPKALLRTSIDQRNWPYRKCATRVFQEQYLGSSWLGKLSWMHGIKPTMPNINWTNRRPCWMLAKVGLFGIFANSSVNRFAGRITPYAESAVSPTQHSFKVNLSLHYSSSCPILAHHICGWSYFQLGKISVTKP